MRKADFRPDRVGAYFRAEWAALLVVTVSGLIYNIGLLAGPLFEGRMAGRLIDVLNGQAGFADMAALVVIYALITAVVQGARYIKRFYVRRFANNVNRRMKRVLYGHLVRMDRPSLEAEGAGSVMTKAISDVDDCVEGMRKFTTELFDTGVALAAYAVMLLTYDARLALIALVFPPISFFIAEKMKKPVQRAGVKRKASYAALNGATIDRATNAVTYRVFGRESDRRQAYEENLSDYERAAVHEGLLSASMLPLYRIMTMAAVPFIIILGARNIAGRGWTSWDVAAFTTFLSCFTRLATKSSSAAKLFNAVHKAQVSWKRIKPLMHEIAPLEEAQSACVNELRIDKLSFAYPNEKPQFENVTFTGRPGAIIGITGPVASGKSTLGKAFLCEYPYEGHIVLNGRELSDMTQAERAAEIGYLGHDPELLSDSIENNVLMGDAGEAEQWLRMACLDKEVAAMEDGKDTMVGSGGVRLSGGQAQRLALARTLCHKRPIMILDDPFSALDKTTEKQVFDNLRAAAADSIVLLISHRLYLFPQFDQVIWLSDGQAQIGSHEELMEKNADYCRLYREQEEEEHHEAK